MCTHWFWSLFIVNNQIKYQHVNECDGIWFEREFITKFILDKKNRNEFLLLCHEFLMDFSLL